VIGVVHPGPMTTVQDGGRPRLAHLGIPPSGALDRPALELANRLVGNLPGCAGLEFTLLGPRLRFADGAVVALTGAPVEATVDERPVAMNSPTRLCAGQELALGPVSSGLRGYLAVRGGIEVEPVLGSRSADLLTGLGPPPLRGGDELSVGTPTLPMPGVDLAPVPDPEPEPVLRVVLGPRAERFSAKAVDRLVSSRFVATEESNRVGLRLRGPTLDRAGDGELLSEGVVSGALQVPGDGQPILLLADHPTTGGYPVIAVVVSADLPLAAQVRPGASVRFMVAR
jgi:biotin-dependent carboxylase-like uncharacterized protein